MSSKAVTTSRRRPQMHFAGLAIDDDRVAGARRVGDAFRRGRPAACPWRGRRWRRGWCEPPSSSTSAAQLVAAIIEQFGRAHGARDQRRRLAASCRRRRAGLAGQMAQQPVRQIVEIVQPLAQHRDRPGAARGRGFRPARARPRLPRSGRCAPHRACAGASPGHGRTGDRPRSPRGPRRSESSSLELSISSTDAAQARRWLLPAAELLGRIVGDQRSTLTRGSCSTTRPTATPSDRPSPANCAAGRSRSSGSSIRDIEEAALRHHLGQHHGDGLQRLDLLLGIVALRCGSAPSARRTPGRRARSARRGRT